jgi:hypothetical protein
MRFLTILAAASLALSPAIAAAQTGTAGTSGNSDQKKPAPGPLAGRALDRSEIPTGAIIVGGLVLLGGIIIGIIAGSDSNNNTNHAGTPPK